MKQLKIVTWNIGFGAMGAEAEMKMDGGSRFIPSSRSRVKKNMQGILEYLRTADTDILLLQEVSFGSLLNYWHNIERRIRKVLKPFQIQFAPTFRIPLWIRFLRNEHGTSTYIHNKYTVQSLTTYTYNMSEVYYRILHRKDNFIVTTITTEDGAKPLAIINTHLASFDKGGAIRRSQCEEVLTHAQQLHTEGYAVLIGGDWNMRLRRVNALSDAVRYKYTFPFELLPPSWSVHTSSTEPTVRSANEPYQNGHTSTEIIDGFICSPDITANALYVDDLQFAFSDHQPVHITISY